MDEIERRVICDMLERTEWNQTEAAEIFQIPLSTLNQKIKRLGIDVRRRGIGRAGALNPPLPRPGNRRSSVRARLNPRYFKTCISFFDCPEPRRLSGRRHPV